MFKELTTEKIIMNNIKVIRIQDDNVLQEAMKIRYKVFVEEQKVPAEEELDEFETSARHFLALEGSKPLGTARWRFTAKGCKLERFAVLEEARGKGVGKALVKAVVEDIEEVIKKEGKKEILMYLHGQVTAVPLYEKFGFIPAGNPFDECGIMHYYMSKMLVL
ncbi:MAG: GNAT family N-acetyltransferase [Flammeovirgaceae bacterium]